MTNQFQKDIKNIEHNLINILACIHLSGMSDKQLLDSIIKHAESIADSIEKYSNDEKVN